MLKIKRKEVYRSTRAWLVWTGMLIAGVIAAGADALTLAGQVLDPQNRGVAGATVTLTSSAGEEKSVSEATGHFSFTDLAPGSYRLSAAADGFQGRSLRRSLQASIDDLQIRLDLASVAGEIVVTAGLPELATEIDLKGRDLREAGKPDLSASLREVAGLSAVRRGPINLEPTVRGLQEDQVGMFVDGTRTFAAGPARMDSNLSHVSPRLAENIRVIKGPYALAWGAGTLSAIEVETPRPSFSAGGLAWNGSLAASYGENSNSADAFTGFWGGNERWRFYLGAGHRTGEDYETGDGSLVPADYESTEGRWRLGFRPNDRWLLEWSGGYQEQFDIDYPGRLLDATYFYTRSQALELTWKGDRSVREVYAQIYANSKDHLMNNDEKPTAEPNPNRIPPFAIEVALPAESNTSGGRFRVALERGALAWTLGVDAYRVEQQASRTISRRGVGVVLFEDIVWPEAELENLGAYAQAIYRQGNARLGATLRVDSFDASTGEVSPFFLANTTGDTDRGETFVSAALSSTFDVGSHWILNAGIGRAVRAPTVLELYSDRFPATKFQLAAEFMGNPDLDEEESLELDLGARARYGDLLFEVEVFYRQVDNYITVAADPALPRRLPLSPPTVFRYVNGSEATYYGGELLISQRPSDRFSWRAALSYVRAEDEELDEPVLGIAPLHGELGARFYPLRDRLWIDLAAKLYDRQDRVAASRFEQETPGYTLFDLRSGYRLSQSWSVELGVENLTDKSYGDHLNSPNPFTRERILEIGRQVSFGFEVGF